MNVRRPPAILLYGARILVAVVILGAAGGISQALIKMKKAPEVEERPEQVLRVKAIPAHRESTPIALEGFGTVRSAAESQISSELNGRVIKLHPKLELGGIIEKDAVLIQLDSEQFSLQRDSLKAELSVINAQLAELETELTNTQSLLALREKQEAISKRDLKRIESLFKESSIGSESDVDRATSALIDSSEQVQALRNRLRAIPASQETLRQRQGQIQRQIALAELNIEKCTIKAPFTGRITSKQVDLGQAINNGQTMLTLVDDSRLELSIPLDGSLVARWLKLKENGSLHEGWFAQPEPVPVTIYWSSHDRQNLSTQKVPYFTGMLDRIQDIDVRNRTIQAVAVVDNPRPDTSDTPLVPGMFCRVVIPGKTLSDSYRIPRTALQGEKTVYVSSEGRLDTREVVIAYEQGEDLIISDGLQDKDLVITSRIITPVIGMRVDANGASTDSDVDINPVPLADSTPPSP